MPNCAFLTLEDRTGFFIYDQLVFEPLQELGWSVEEIPWSRAGVDWAQFDAVVIRSTWDYQNDAEAFLRTLKEIELKTVLLNSAAICQWNLNKKYLHDLELKGVPIVPTNWLESLSEESLADLFQRHPVPRVAKPLVGANADDTFVIDPEDQTTWVEPVRVFAQRPMMLQPFIDSIRSEGEYSLFYFGGEFSHAIVKRPAEGDFRVQEEHGGAFQLIEPSDELMQTAETTLNAMGQTLLYARVDLVRLDDGRPVLIELELIEPSLYFEVCDEAATRFAAQLDRMVAAKN